MQLVENLTYTLWGLFSYWLELKQLPPWKPETLIVSQGLQCIFLGWEVICLLRDISFYEKRRAKPPWPGYRIIPWNWELWLFHKIRMISALTGIDEILFIASAMILPPDSVSISRARALRCYLCNLVCTLCHWGKFLCEQGSFLCLVVWLSHPSCCCPMLISPCSMFSLLDSS